MKGILVFCGSLVFVTAVVLGWLFLRPDRYGGTFQDAPMVAPQLLLDSPETYLGKLVRIEGRVHRQCQVTGCYFFILVGERPLRIEMGDVVPSLPRRDGYLAVVEGELGKYGEGYQFYGKAVEFRKGS